MSLSFDDKPAIPSILREKCFGQAANTNVCATEIKRHCLPVLSEPRASDKDIYESPGALLPVRARRHVSDADESPKKIDRIQVLPYVAALDCSLYECANRSPDLLDDSLRPPDLARIQRYVMQDQRRLFELGQNGKL